MAGKRKKGCPGHARHWFSIMVGVRAPVCVRCGHPNPKPLTEQDWEELEAHDRYRPIRGHVGEALAKHRAEKSVRGFDVAAARELVDWLDSEQDPESYVTQFGVGKDYGDFYVYIAPGPPSQAKATGGSVMVFSVRDEAKRYKGEGWNRELTNGITGAERDQLEALVAAVVPVHDAWNGLGARCETCSFHVAKDPGPDVARAYQHYSDRPGVAAPAGRPFVVGLVGRGGGGVDDDAHACTDLPDGDGPADPRGRGPVGAAEHERGGHGGRGRD
jgi:hypothetical protein